MMKHMERVFHMTSQAKLKFSSTESKLNILKALALEKSYHPVIAFCVIRKNLVLYILTSDLIENAL